MIVTKMIVTKMIATTTIATTMIVTMKMIQSQFFCAVSFLLDWLPQRLHTTSHPGPFVII